MKYQCNNCKEKYYSYEGILNCPCKFKKKVKWNTPKKHKSSESNLLKFRLLT